MKTHSPIFVEVEFRKSSRSQPNLDCVHVARHDGWVELRDTEALFGSPDDGRLVFTADQFDRFLLTIREQGDLTGQCIDITVNNKGLYVFRSTLPQLRDVTLKFTETELFAFFDGVREGEFSTRAFASA
jgi:hypothetical protein